MIELTETIRLALEGHSGEPLRLVDPTTQQAFVLLRAEEYERLADNDVDYGPWTQEEMDLLAAETADALGWDGMEVYQDQKP